VQPPRRQDEARAAFAQAWDYSFFWNILISRAEFGDLRTDMGHAEYAAGGVDRRDTISCPFTDPEQVLAFDPIEAFGRQDHAARLRHIAGTRWGLRKYMRMDSLREMDTAAGVAAAMAS